MGLDVFWISKSGEQTHSLDDDIYPDSKLTLNQRGNMTSKQR